MIVAGRPSSYIPFIFLGRRRLRSGSLFDAEWQERLAVETTTHFGAITITLSTNCHEHSGRGRLPAGIVPCTFNTHALPGQDILHYRLDNSLSAAHALDQALKGV
jgi:hypothetical protein